MIDFLFMIFQLFQYFLEAFFSVYNSTVTNEAIALFFFYSTFVAEQALINSRTRILPHDTSREVGTESNKQHLHHFTQTTTTNNEIWMCGRMNLHLLVR